MSQLRVLCRVVTYNLETCSILLVRNRGQEWWCAPGGGWDYTRETILQCGTREMLEETGVRVSIVRLLYLQTLYIEKQDNTQLEQFWLAKPIGRTEIPHGHIDQFGIVEEARWFNSLEIQAITVYPEILKKSFWDAVTGIIQEENRYLGHSIL